LLNIYCFHINITHQKLLQSKTWISRFVPAQLTSASGMI